MGGAHFFLSPVKWIAVGMEVECPFPMLEHWKCHLQRVASAQSADELVGIEDEEVCELALR